jgi:hypothetical protein
MHYNLAAKFWQQSRKSRRISIFVFETLLYTNTNLNAFSKEQDIEVCAVKLHVSSINIYNFIC